MHLVTHEINGVILGRFTQWRNHVEIVVPEDKFKAFVCKKTLKFIFVSMFSDGCQILLKKLSKFEQIN